MESDEIECEHTALWNCLVNTRIFDEKTQEKGILSEHDTQYVAVGSRAIKLLRIEASKGEGA